MLKRFDFNDDYLGRFDWTVNDVEASTIDRELREQVTLLTVQVLLQKGFIFGQDFSMSHDRKILTTRAVEKIILVSVPVPEQILLRQILQVF
jgi:hypothetical protein